MSARRKPGRPHGKPAGPRPHGRPDSRRTASGGTAAARPAKSDDRRGAGRPDRPADRGPVAGRPAHAGRETRIEPSLQPGTTATAPAPVPVRALECPHFPPCAGCPLIPTPYAEQLESKRRTLAEAIAPILPPGADADLVVRATVPSKRLRGYRNQARLVFRQMSRGGYPHMGLGMYSPGTHRVIHIPECPIQPDRLNKVAATAVQLAEEMQFTSYDERTGEGCLRYLALRCDRARRKVLVTIIVGEDAGAPLHMLAGRLRELHPEVVGVGLHQNFRHSNVLFAGEDLWTEGATRLEDEIGPFRIPVSSRSFLQVNHEQAEWIYTRLAEVLALATAPGAHDAAPAAAPGERGTPLAAASDPAGEVVLDLYSGVGGIALYLARAGRTVIGVEESAEAVEDARRAAHMNNASGVRFVPADVEAFLRDPAAFGVDLAGRHVAAVVLNPPRAGCGTAVMEAIAALAPERIAYVSCRAFSLVRDLRVLGAAYSIVEATPVDMIPLTPHVESLTLLERAWDASP